MSYPILALDAATGTSHASLILSAHDALYAKSEGSREHSRSLMPRLEGLLAEAGLSWQSLHMLALGIGPGSFTGLRIAAATMAGINASLQLPVLSVPSLAITASRCNEDTPLWVLEDARSGEVFAGRYQQGTIIIEAQCMRWQAVSDLEPGPFVSESELPVSLPDWTRVDPVISRSQALAMAVRSLLDRTHSDDLQHYVEPVYLQVSQAERNLGL